MSHARDIFFVVLFTFVVLAFVDRCSAQAQIAVPWVGNGNHQPHDYSFGPIQVPADVTVAHVVFDAGRKASLAGQETMTIGLNLSLNGGMTFSPAGGDTFSAAKQPTDFSVLLAGAGNVRVLEGRLTLYGGPWRGKVDVVLE